MKQNYDLKNAKRGAVLPTPPGKTRITIRIDDDVLEWFRKRVHDAGGGNYQTMMNLALREHMEKEAEPLEATLRRVLREVLPESGSKGQRKTSRKTSVRNKASSKGRGKK